MRWATPRAKLSWAAQTHFISRSNNAEHCYSAGTGTLVTVAPDAACAAGFTHTVLSNSYPSTQANAIFEPRVSGTYTLDPTAVVRFSAGTYSQPARAAYVQYNNTGDTAAYLASRFLQYGFTTPSHAIPPQVSNNYDLSFEKRLKNIPVSFSFSPFYRLTENQTQAFVLDPTSSFQSGSTSGRCARSATNCWHETGNFERDGLSAQLAFTYTNSKFATTTSAERPATSSTASITRSTARSSTSLRARAAVAVLHRCGRRRPRCRDRLPDGNAGQSRTIR